MLQYLLAIAAAATFANQSPTEPPAIAPASGSYLALLYVPSASGTGCVMGSGSQLIAEVSYSGFAGKTFYVKSPYAGSSGQVISLQTMTVTSGAGTLTPSGTFTWTGYGAYNWNVNGTFTASIQEVGAHAFMLNLTEVYSNCTENQSLSLVRMGVDNN